MLTGSCIGGWKGWGLWSPWEAGGPAGSLSLRVLEGFPGGLAGSIVCLQPGRGLKSQTEEVVGDLTAASIPG